MKGMAIKKEIATIRAYFGKLFRRWWLYIGFLPVVFDLVTTYFPQVPLPTLTPSLSVAILASFFLLASYSLFKETWYVVRVRLIDGKVEWDQYGVSRYVWSCFLVKLEIDNFASNHPDYVSVSLTADTQDGRWIADHFVFEGINKPDQPLRIEPRDVVKEAKVFISDHNLTRAGTKEIPLIDRKTLKLQVETKSGTKFEVPIKEEDIYPKS